VIALLVHPSLPWIVCAVVCGACALILRWSERRASCAARARDAYRDALATALRRQKKRKARGASRDWRDSLLATRVADDQRLTAVWRRPTRA
jgi:hypothetical protein